MKYKELWLDRSINAMSLDEWIEWFQRLKRLHGNKLLDFDAGPNNVQVCILEEIKDAQDS